jgi:hypothetical protein
MIMMEVDSEANHDEVKGLVEDHLNDLLEEEEHDGAIDVFTDATSDEIDTVTAAQEVTELVDRCVTNLRQRCTADGSVTLFGPGIGQIEHGITDIRACCRTLCKGTALMSKSLQERMRETISKTLERMGMHGVEIMPPIKDLKQAPIEALHAIAHTMGLESCDGMERSDYIQFIEKKMEEAETERRKEVN